MVQGKKEKLLAKDIEASWNSNPPIYFSNRMTPLNKFLFFIAESTAKQVGYIYVWFSKNKIFVKKMKARKLLL